MKDEIVAAPAKDAPPVDAVFSLWQGPNHCVNAYEKEKARYNSPPAMRG